MFDARIHQLIAADTTLQALVPGGIYLDVNLHRDGIKRATLPSAYDATTGLVRPLIAVRGRAIVATGLRDSSQGWRSVRQIVEVWVFADGDAAHLTLDAAAKRLFLLLDQTRTNGMSIQFIGQDNGWDDDVSARYIQQSYQVDGLREKQA